jgi:hypothetical protein
VRSIRRLAPVLLLPLAIPVLFGVRSHSELLRGLAEPNPAVAWRHFDASVGYHFPGNPWSRRAAEELAGRARGLESSGERGGALFLWRRIRPLAASTRSFYSPFAELESEAAAAIERLEAPERRGGGGALPPPAALPRDPSPLAVGGLTIGLAGALAAFLRMLREPPGRLRRRLALAAAGAALLFWILLAAA